MGRDLSRTALLVIDLQTGLDDPRHGPRNNPDCEANVGRLLAAWRAAGRPVIFVRHDSTRPDSLLRPDRPGNAFKPVVSGEPDLLVGKSTGSAFLGQPDLHAWLTRRRVTGVAIAGAQTNQCCESTARMAVDLGYEVLFVLDATFTFDLAAHDGGRMIPADQVARVTAANLQGEVGEVVTTAALLGPGARETTRSRPA